MRLYRTFLPVQNQLKFRSFGPTQGNFLLQCIFIVAWNLYLSNLKIHSFGPILFRNCNQGQIFAPMCFHSVRPISNLQNPIEPTTKLSPGTNTRGASFPA